MDTSTYTCAISGLQLQPDCYLQQTLNLSQLTDDLAHPIFSVKYRNLQNLTARNIISDISTNEMYLILCALMHNTDTLIYRDNCTFKRQDDDIVQALYYRYSDRLYKLGVSLVDAITHPRLKTPSFSVSTTDKTNRLSILIPPYINTLESTLEAHNEIYARQYESQKNARLQNSVNNYKFIALEERRAYGSAAYEKKMLLYIEHNIINPHCEPILASSFTHILRCVREPEKLIKCSSNAITGLLEVFRMHLKHSDDYYDDAMQLISDISAITENYLGDWSYDKKQAVNYCFVEDCEEQKEPEQKDYKTKIDYLKALAQYKLNKQKGI